jgi:hypothetical protein
MGHAAAGWRSRPSMAAGRTMSGVAALDHLDRMLWLEYQRAAGDLITIEIEIEHRVAP